MFRNLLLVALLTLVAAPAQAQHPRTRHSSGALEWYYSSGSQQNAATSSYVRGVVSGATFQPRRSYYSSSMYGPGYSYTQGYGPFGNYQYNTLSSPGYSYTSGYGVPWYGAGGFGGGY